MRYLVTIINPGKPMHEFVVDTMAFKLPEDVDRAVTIEDIADQAPPALLLTHNTQIHIYERT
jgi:hypothetical protein